MGNFEGKMPKELKRAHYHRWGLKKQERDVNTLASGQNYLGLLDTVKKLGHDKLDVIDIFKIDCEFDLDCFPGRSITGATSLDLISNHWNDFAYLSR
jgi:hypothetical protein